MKKMLRTAVLAVGTFLSVSAFGQGASVVKDYGCLLLASDSGLSVSLVTNERTQSVVTPSGNTVLTCHFLIPNGFAPARAIVKTGFLCGTFLGLTYDSRSVVSPGGQATLTCEIKH